MLHEFLTRHREPIITRAREKLTNRPWPLASTSELTNGVPRFLTQLVETLRSDAPRNPDFQTAIGASATLHGRDLLSMGFNVSQVVHDYGDICQAITELVVEENVPLTAREFNRLNECLDTAIAEAVTEHARLTAEARSTFETHRSGQLAHEIRDLLNTAVFAFEALKRGAVGVEGSTGAVLGRSLVGLRNLVETTLADVRMEANYQRRERMPVAALLEHVAVAGYLHAEYRGVQLKVEPVAPGLVIHIDPQLFASAVSNLLNNAFKYTAPGGRIELRAYREDRRLRIEIEDECGGIPDSQGDPFRPFADRLGDDRSGLGLGLSIARKAVREHGGDIHIRNMPGKGCVFIIEVPLSPEEQVPPLLTAS